MNTRKCISTISYNTLPYLEKVLADLIHDELISSYMFIQHKKEEDELKDHIHLFLVPNKQLNTLTLRKRFIEIDLNCPDRPLGVIDFKPSNSDDWILYCLHYSPYLESKCESRIYEYRKEDIHYSDYYIFEDDYYHAFRCSDWIKQYNVIKNIDCGLDPYELITKGIVPISLSSSLIAFDNLKIKHTVRNGRANHE